MLLVPLCPPEFGSGACGLDGSSSIRVPGTRAVRLRAWGRPIDLTAPRSEVEVLGERDGVALTASIDALKAGVERNRSTSCPWSCRSPGHHRRRFDCSLASSRR